MNQDTNNNLNGSVLGSVNNTQNINNNPIPTEPVETLDTGINNNVMGGNQVVDSNQMGGQNTFFNNPEVNNMGANNVGTPNGMPQAPLMEPQPQVEPTPAYTNPQTINPTPMPGFENPGTIGMTPPISLEPEKQPKKKSNKIIFIILILIVLAGVGFGTYYVLNYTDLLNKKEQVTITTKDIELNMGDSLSTNILEYATITGTDSRNCSLNTTNVDTSKEGNYEYTVTCGETVKTGKITVVDNTELVVETKVVYKVKGEELEAKEFAKTVDENITYEFIEPESVNNLLNGEAGTYTVKIRATQNNKTTEIEGTLIITEYKIKGYYTCTSKEQNVTDSSAKMTVAEQFAIVDDGNNGYGNIANEIHTFKFSDETEYTNYLASYKTENKITINNITGDTEFDDENLTITITNMKDNNQVISEFGESNMTNYSTIKIHFINTLGYSCSYKSVE